MDKATMPYPTIDPIDVEPHRLPLYHPAWGRIGVPVLRAVAQPMARSGLALGTRPAAVAMHWTNPGLRPIVARCNGCEQVAVRCELTVASRHGLVRERARCRWFVCSAG